MPFRLTYQGPLRANGDATEKHTLRAHFHHQLRQLWMREPLLSYDQAGYLRRNGKAVYHVNGVEYACVVNEQLHLHCELDILFLRPSPPGAVIRTGGDIDNRLKTLFDGLRMPTDGEVPTNAGAVIADSPFHCLLSDDALISKISVATDQLLEPAVDGHVHLVIAVTVLPTDVTRENLGYIR